MEVEYCEKSSPFLLEIPNPYLIKRYLKLFSLSFHVGCAYDGDLNASKLGSFTSLHHILGSEYSIIHKKKDEFWVKLGAEHRKRRHELYQAMRSLDKEGYSFLNIIETAIDKVEKLHEKLS